MEASASFGVTCTVQVLQRMAAVPGVASLVPLVPLMHACTPCTCMDRRASSSFRMARASSRAQTVVTLRRACPRAPRSLRLPSASSSRRPCRRPGAPRHHEALAGGGGGATFIMDDGYCYGRSEEVLPAIRRFADRLTALGLHLQYTCSSASVPSTRPALFRQRFGPSLRMPEGDEATQTEVCITQPFLPGITVGGVPLGHEAFIRQYMSTCPDADGRRRQPSVSGARLAPAPCSTRGPS